MFDDAFRTRRTDPRPSLGIADYVIASALVAVTSIAGYRLIEEGALGKRLADAGAEAVPIESVPVESSVH